MSLSFSNRLFSDALRDMQRAMAAFEQPLFAVPTARLMGPSFNAPSLLRSNHGAFYPTTDMIETPDAYELHAEIPGYDKKDIKIEMPDSNTLVISGNVSKEYKSQGPSDKGTTTGVATGESSSSKESQQLAATAKDQEKQVSKPSNGHKWLVQERTSGSFVRTFTLPIAVKSETIKTFYNNGVLKVVIPKADNKQSNYQINIE
ncbi:Chitin synthase, class 7 [Mucor velutinosus]|uniref:Chitin synthase, class 7 n=1 Tax=Mucor velutinosus TaxID=708070 RepID=A0AAN7D3W5_9FUNG|nr:Chitin synthase, class 7 [Mucor velutinosus]